MSIDKQAFRAAVGADDLPTVQQYLSQPTVASSVAALERVLTDRHSTCENIQTASRTPMAASRGLWFCVSSEWGGVFCYAVANRHVETVEWFFGEAFAPLCPMTLQVIFLHIARHALAHKNQFMLETLLNSWLFHEAMAPETRVFMLPGLYWAAHSTNDRNVDVLIAHGAYAPRDEVGDEADGSRCPLSDLSA